jgi:hypothetical protein
MLVVFVSYALSTVGIMATFGLALSELVSAKSPDISILLWAAAWVVHFVMSGAWVIDVRLNRAWPIFGILFVLTGFLLNTFVGPFASAEPSVWMEHSSALVTMMFFLVAPCVLLAVWLVGFHLKSRTEQSES